MKKTLILGSIITAFTLIGASAVHAEDSAVTGSATVNNDGATVQVKMVPRPVMQGIRQDARGQVKVLRAEMKTAASSTRADIKDIRKDMRVASGTKKMDLKTEIENRKEDLANRRASTTEAVKTVRFNETMKLSQTHLTQEVSRLSDIKAKIDTRLTKFDTQGVSTVAVRADLALAVTAIADAQTKISAAGSVQLTTDTKASADAVRQAVKDAQTAINAAQTALMKVVSDMKGLEASAHATSSPETR
jgi:hypothetical protein